MNTSHVQTSSYINFSINSVAQSFSTTTTTKISWIIISDVALGSSKWMIFMRCSRTKIALKRKVKSLSLGLYMISRCSLMWLLRDFCCFKMMFFFYISIYYLHLPASFFFLVSFIYSSLLPASAYSISDERNTK